MNYMIEALGRDIRAMWNRFAWHPTIDAMQAAMLREVWAKWIARKHGPWMSRMVIDSIIKLGPFGTSKIPLMLGNLRTVAPRLIEPRDRLYVLRDGTLMDVPDVDHWKVGVVTPTEARERWESGL